MPDVRMLERLLRRGSRSADPAAYPSPDGVCVVAQRRAYRKGPAKLIINSPSGESGVRLRKGKYPFEGGDSDYENICFQVGEANGVFRDEDSVRIQGDYADSVTLHPGGEHQGVRVNVEEGFYKSLLRSEVFMFQDNRIALYSSDQCSALYVGKQVGDVSLNGVVIPTPMTRALLREGFYSFIKFFPTQTHHYVGNGSQISSGGEDGLGICIMVTGEDGECYRIIQPGSLIAS